MQPAGWLAVRSLEGHDEILPRSVCFHHERTRLGHPQVRSEMSAAGNVRKKQGIRLSFGLRSFGAGERAVFPGLAGGDSHKFSRSPGKCENLKRCPGHAVAAGVLQRAGLPELFASQAGEMKGEGE